VDGRQPLAKEDQVKEKTFNEAIWKSVKGAGSTMPAPVTRGAVPRTTDHRTTDPPHDGPRHDPDPGGAGGAGVRVVAPPATPSRLGLSG